MGLGGGGGGGMGDGRVAYLARTWWLCGGSRAVGGERVSRGRSGGVLRRERNVGFQMGMGDGVDVWVKRWDDVGSVRGCCGSGEMFLLQEQNKRIVQNVGRDMRPRNRRDLRVKRWDDVAKVLWELYRCARLREQNRMRE